MSVEDTAKLAEQAAILLQLREIIAEAQIAQTQLQQELDTAISTNDRLNKQLTALQIVKDEKSLVIHNAYLAAEALRTANLSVPPPLQVLSDGEPKP